MTENTRNRSNEGRENLGRSAFRSRRESENRVDRGFEGMNFEQRRGPYNPSRSEDDQRDDTRGGNRSGNQRDDA